jgi:TPR repeat protein
MARFVWSDFEQSPPAPKARELDAETMLRMGLDASTGRNGDYDLVAAHKWFNLASLRGSQKAKTYRMEIARELDRAELREAQRQARQWLSRR